MNIRENRKHSLFRGCRVDIDAFINIYKQRADSENQSLVIFYSQNENAGEQYGKLFVCALHLLWFTGYVFLF